MCSFRCFCADHQHSRVANDVQSLWPSVNLVGPNHQHYIHNFSILSMPFDSSTVVPFLLQALISQIRIALTCPASRGAWRAMPPQQSIKIKHQTLLQNGLKQTSFAKVKSCRILKWFWLSPLSTPNHHHTFSTGILEAVSGPDTLGQPFSRKKPLVPMVGCKEQKELGAMIKIIRLSM